MSKVKFYIASSLENADRVSALAAALKRAGWEQTYDWTAHGSVEAETFVRKQEVALAESLGVSSADHVIVLLPGGRGTHTEFGMAIAWDKKITIFAASILLLKAGGRGCVFYEHPNVQIILGLNIEEMVEAFLRDNTIQLKKEVSK